MTYFMNCAFIGGLMFFVAACGTATDQPVLRVIGTAVGQIGQPAEDPLAGLTPDVVAQVSQPFITVTLPATGARATMGVFAETDGRREWRAGDAGSVVMIDDIVIATRGLGDDLFHAELDRVSAAIAAGSGTSTRRHVYLDGENRMQQLRFTCQISTGNREIVDLINRRVTATKINEICVEDGQIDPRFGNTYWVTGSAPEIVQSQQWIGPQSGFIIIQHLVR
ncbi:MAG: YjbF family lipoprotein [Loktanella sp.]|nr:YjbF family lipoprotein [Loktanella sp.]